MKTHNALDTIRLVSSLLEGDHKFAFATYTRSAVFALTGELPDDKKAPKNFIRLISASMQNKDQYFFNAAQRDLIKLSSEKIKENHKIDLSKSTFYDSNFMEHYINTNYDVFKTFMSWYFKTTKTIIVSFQGQASISRYFSKDSIFINAPYNDFYTKIDAITEQVIQQNKSNMLCVLDCPMLSTALVQNLWEKSSISSLDLGRTLTVAKSVNQSR